MSDINLKKICPLPWLHFSAHLDATMRICCNTDDTGFIFDNSGQTVKLGDVHDISEYFNLDHYKRIRIKMMNGEEPEECRKCYQVEKHGGLSVRQGYLGHYSQDPTFIKNLKETDKETGEINPTVQSLDFSLSNKCNLKCIMCSPHASYIIKNDYDKLNIEYGKEFTEGARKNWKNLEGLKKVIPLVSPSLKEFLTTGGEPFLSDEHYEILKMIVEAGHASQVKLSYHTNCTVKSDRLLKLWENFQTVSVHLSVDAFGPLNEYIRYQTKWMDVVENVDILTSHPKARCEVHSTIQALNVVSLPELYDWIRTLGKVPHMPFHIWMDHPNWLRMDVLPPELLQTALEKLDSYFSSLPSTDQDTLQKREQIVSYIKRAIGTYQGDVGFQDFKSKIRQFEGIRNTPKIEDLVPEFKALFK